MALKTLTPVFVALAFLTVGCGDGDDDIVDATPNADVEAILTLTGDETAGASVFSSTCSACHGADGDSGYAADLTSVVPARSDERIIEAVIYGDGSMPAQSALTDQEVADVLAYCRDTFGG